MKGSGAGIDKDGLPFSDITAGFFSDGGLFSHRHNASAHIVLRRWRLLHGIRNRRTAMKTHNGAFSFQVTKIASYGRAGDPQTVHQVCCGNTAILLQDLQYSLSSIDINHILPPLPDFFGTSYMIKGRLSFVNVSFSFVFIFSER